MWRALGLILVFALALPSSAAAQKKVTEMELRTLMNEQRRAVDLYRDGHIDEALAVVQARTGSMNQAIAERILQWLDDPAPQLRDPKRQLVQHWTPSLVAALAALHMEMALRIYTGRGGVDSFHLEVRTARRLFEAAAKRDERASDLLPGWILAIGSTAHADGQLWWAADILDDACRAPHAGERAQGQPLPR